MGPDLGAGRESGPGPGRRERSMTRDTTRLEAFSDGVFAIAITLLILEIRVPGPAAGHDNGWLNRELWALWPSLLAFCLSFWVILVMWVNHHELLRLVRGVDRSEEHTSEPHP